MTESEIQEGFRRWSVFNGALLPNAYIPGGWTECDLLGVTRAGYLYQWEIKLTRTDFLRDFAKKREKHRALFDAWENGRAIMSKQFWFIAPEDVAPVVPCYAGLIWVTELAHPAHRYQQKPWLSFDIVVEAPLLPGRKCTFKEMRQLLGKACFKMWDARDAVQELSRRLSSREAVAG